MRIVVLDGSTASDMALADALDAAIGTLVTRGASVLRVRLDELSIRTCRECSVCASTGTCRFEDDVVPVVELIASANGLIAAAPSRGAHVDGPLARLLPRLRRCCAASSPAPRRGSGLPAVLIGSNPSPEPIARMLGHAEAPLRELAAGLAAVGAKVDGTLSLAAGPLHRDAGITARGQAVMLARTLSLRLAPLPAPMRPDQWEIHRRSRRTAVA